MLSRWQREYLDGKLRRQGPRMSPVSNNEKHKTNKKELTENIKLNMENDLLKSGNGILRNNKICGVIYGPIFFI